VRLNVSLTPLLVRPKDFNALPPAKLRFIEPMYALPVQNLPEGKEWLYEVEFDGYRCLAGRDSTRVTLWSRRANLFTNQFPKIARACERLPPGNLIDGEIVVRNGFVPQVRREVVTKFKRLETDTCPFANLPERKRTQWALTKEEMKNCVWLKTGAGRPNRVHRMDAGWSLEAFKVCRAKRR
jgi:ATP-dependent DNA ligase